MQLESAGTSLGKADAGELRWSNDGAQTVGVEDLPGLFAALCTET